MRNAITRVHRGDQLACGWKVGLERGARDRDAPVFQRLAQIFEHVPVEFREFVPAYTGFLKIQGESKKCVQWL